MLQKDDTVIEAEFMEIAFSLVNVYYKIPDGGIGEKRDKVCMYLDTWV